mmetsp:Transcript_19168/g.41763  ORF Transcript_19168/g.41763 Transcript_19168/m.41763 type:complete len:102 (+) Transcript_19168:671-976(+)
MMSDAAFPLCALEANCPLSVAATACIRDAMIDDVAGLDGKGRLFLPNAKPKNPDDFCSCTLLGTGDTGVPVSRDAVVRGLLLVNIFLPVIKAIPGFGVAPR